MKLRITEKNMEHFEGQMGAVDFVNGLSTSDVRPKDALRIGAAMGCEWEDGSSPNPSQIYLESMNNAAPTDAEQADMSNLDLPKPIKGKEKPTINYTEDYLAIIADEHGIAGLRAIAEPLGIKGNTISNLITAILKVSPAKKAQAKSWKSTLPEQTLAQQSI